MAENRDIATLVFIRRERAAMQYALHCISGEARVNEKLSCYKNAIMLVMAAVALFFLGACAAYEQYIGAPPVQAAAESKYYTSGDYIGIRMAVVDFMTLESGTRVDARIDKEIVDLLFRHFEAIENGDVMAFRVCGHTEGTQICEADFSQIRVKFFAAYL